MSVNQKLVDWIDRYMPIRLVRDNKEKNAVAWGVASVVLALSVLSFTSGGEGDVAESVSTPSNWEEQVEANPALAEREAFAQLLLNLPVREYADLADSDETERFKRALEQRMAGIDLSAGDYLTQLQQHVYGYAVGEVRAKLNELKEGIEDANDDIDERNQALVKAFELEHETRLRGYEQAGLSDDELDADDLLYGLIGKLGDPWLVENDARFKEAFAQAEATMTRLYSHLDERLAQVRGERALKSLHEVRLEALDARFQTWLEQNVDDQNLEKQIKNEVAPLRGKLRSAAGTKVFDEAYEAARGALEAIMATGAPTTSDDAAASEE